MRLPARTPDRSPSVARAGGQTQSSTSFYILYPQRSRLATVLSDRADDDARIPQRSAPTLRIKYASADALIRLA